MEELFAQIAHVAKVLVEGAAVLIVFYGAIEAFAKLLWIVVTPSATHGERKALWRRFYEEVWDQGNTDFAYEVFADDYVRHDLRPTQALPGPAGQKKIAAEMQAQAFSDVPYVPLGQYFAPTAFQATLSGVLTGNPVFWNIQKG